MFLRSSHLSSSLFFSFRVFELGLLPVFVVVVVTTAVVVEVLVVVRVVDICVVPEVSELTPSMLSRGTSTSFLSTWKPSTVTVGLVVPSSVVASTSPSSSSSLAPSDTS